MPPCKVRASCHQHSDLNGQAGQGSMHGGHQTYTLFNKLQPCLCCRASGQTQLLLAAASRDQALFAGRCHPPTRPSPPPPPTHSLTRGSCLGVDSWGVPLGTATFRSSTVAGWYCSCCCSGAGREAGSGRAPFPGVGRQARTRHLSSTCRVVGGRVERGKRPWVRTGEAEAEECGAASHHATQ